MTGALVLVSLAGLRADVVLVWQGRIDSVTLH